MRGGGRGMRGMGRGRSNPRMNDMFRSRKQNTSRPPSMHVDDFMAMESGKTQDSPSMRRPGPKVRSLAPENGVPRFSNSPELWENSFHRLLSTTALKV